MSASQGQSLTLLLEALHFAADRHRGQVRKGKARYPYINHPIKVASVLASCGVDDLPTLQAALLHDTIEDTDATPDELALRFGDEVSALVLEVTDDRALPKRKRKELQIEHAPALSARAKRLKIADKICNVLDVALDPPRDWSDTRRREYLDWASAVAERCLDAGPAALVAAWREAIEAARGEV